MCIFQKEIQALEIPHHVGFSVDGNRRWSRNNGFSDPNEGHRIGAGKVEKVIEWCRRDGIDTATFHLMSADNFHRPIDELQPLLRIVEELVERISSLSAVRELRVLGDFAIMPERTSSILASAARHGLGRRDGPRINLLIGYDGHGEIIKAFHAALRAYREKDPDGQLDAADIAITPGDIDNNLDTHGLPDPDLIVRTGGEQRLSGFLPWQSTYSELYFTKVLWPDLQYTDFRDALNSYKMRSRRFGR